MLKYLLTRIKDPNSSESLFETRESSRKFRYSYMEKQVMNEYDFTTKVRLGLLRLSTA